MRRAVTESAVWWVLLMALNTVLIREVTALEMVVGAAAALLGAVGARTVRRASGASFGGPAHLALSLWVWPGALLADTLRLARAVLRPRRFRGGFRVIELPAGTGPAWACALLSATPGLYVVHVDPDSGRSGPRRLTVHAVTDEVGSLERALVSGGRR
ncbi:hypothetical protein [Streptomyces sp. NBC_00454]|uniref:hypothetical protein n=1 Tax=Streptomyces sp. NBC_00454 TaxID=2975747 RepID=UPI0030E4AF0F